MAVEENIEHQRALYGEPLGDLIRRLSTSLGRSQAALAQVLGMSPAMLSHLATGQRVKIANPVALHRLRALIELEPVAVDLSSGELDARLAAIAGLSADLTTSGPPTASADGPSILREALTAVASRTELTAAANTLRAIAPGLAELIRVYGTGEPLEQTRHYAAIRRLRPER
ncbi:helix-turn-helix domain-containing protein [Nocardioides montaniterrae]